MTEQTHLEWSPEAIEKAADALGDALFGASPEEAFRPFLLIGAAVALQAIGDQLANSRGDGWCVELPAQRRNRAARRRRSRP